MTGGKGGGGVAESGVLGRSPFDPSMERAHAQVAASVQVQVQARVRVQLTFRRLPHDFPPPVGGGRERERECRPPFPFAPRRA